jgi:glycogen operon protein
LWEIETDPVLAGTKLLAEAWDAAGLYQVGSFVGDTWQEWNGRFRDDVRDFLRGQDGAVRRVADRILGSPAIYGQDRREAEQSVNFITCHDGFTLNDLVSYNAKHNAANGEENQDGTNDNRSWNCGVEGPTDDPEIERLRNRQAKNALSLVLLSLGMPMILMGDEVRRTQLGNNNAYCQDNEISWLDWSLVDEHADLLRFVSLLNERRRHREFNHEHLSLVDMLKSAHMSWHGVKLNQPDWSDSSHSVALGAELPTAGLMFHLILNGHCEPLAFELPNLGSPRGWRRWIDTFLPTPEDIVPWREAPAITDYSYLAHARSVVMLFAPIEDAAWGQLAAV